jgi:hypothetical protein
MLERGGEEVAQALINLTARLQVGLMDCTCFQAGVVCMCDKARWQAAKLRLWLALSALHVLHSASNACMLCARSMESFPALLLLQLRHMCCCCCCCCQAAGEGSSDVVLMREACYRWDTN